MKRGVTMHRNNCMRWLMRLLVLLCAAAQLLAPLAQAAEAEGAEQARRQVTQPGNNAPFWRDVREGENPYQTTQVRGVDTKILVQSSGETWREIRNGPISLYGGILLIAVPFLIFAFYRWKG